MNGSRWCSQSEWNGIAGDDELVVAGVVGERGRAELRRGEQLGVHPRHPARRVAQALLGEVDAEGVEQVARGPLRAGEVDGARGAVERVQVGDCVGHTSFGDARAPVLPALGGCLAEAASKMSIASAPTTVCSQARCSGSRSVTRRRA